MKSIEIIEKKEKKGLLTYGEIEYMVNSYVKGKINDKTMSDFVWSIYHNGLTIDETYYLTDVMIKSGEVIDLSKINKPIVDKHSTGGVGDKITLIVSPIVAAAGVCVPKMSGRGLGLTGGTVDKLESIPGYKLKLSRKAFVEELEKVGCAVISQSEKIALADKKIYALRNEIGAVDSIPLIASSIMSKKIASGSDIIIIDLKVGKGAFMKNIKDATKLAKTMVKIGKYYDKKVICTLSDMNIPLGCNIGNALEVREVIDFFNGRHEKRLYDLSVYISSLMISSAKKISFASAKRLVINLLESGHAKNKFYEWIRYQGGDITKLKDKARKYIVMSNKSGYLNSIDSLKLSQLVFDLGAGRVKKTDNIDYAVGVMLNKTVGQKVMKGEILGVIFYNKKVENMDKIFADSFNIEPKKKRYKNIIIKTIK
ncbi:MAG: thymidine phosphorylase [Bacilli bacterium]|nr:thymidine phosphorylase [Bacilli bacterium]